MDLRTVLTPETVELHLQGKTKEDIIDEMLEILIKAGKVTDKAAESLFHTEKQTQYLI